MKGGIPGIQRGPCQLGLESEAGLATGIGEVATFGPKEAKKCLNVMQLQI